MEKGESDQTHDYRMEMGQARIEFKLKNGFLYRKKAWRDVIIIRQYGGHILIYQLLLGYIT